ncbi:hypothetical protein HK102_007590 [Quaeritorhiza haematococci]|nr:hypothetical protein HK102_007590 [Quaeritorhiza haematococci]
MQSSYLARSDWDELSEEWPSEAAGSIKLGGYGSGRADSRTGDHSGDIGRTSSPHSHPAFPDSLTHSAVASVKIQSTRVSSPSAALDGRCNASSTKASEKEKSAGQLPWQKGPLKDMFTPLSLERLFNPFQPLENLNAVDRKSPSKALIHKSPPRTTSAPDKHPAIVSNIETGVRGHEQLKEKQRSGSITSSIVVKARSAQDDPVYRSRQVSSASTLLPEQQPSEKTFYDNGIDDDPRGPDDTRERHISASRDTPGFLDEPPSSLLDSCDFRDSGSDSLQHNEQTGGSGVADTNDFSEYSNAIMDAPFSFEVPLATDSVERERGSVRPFDFPPLATGSIERERGGVPPLNQTQLFQLEYDTTSRRRLSELVSQLDYFEYIPNENGAKRMRVDKEKLHSEPDKSSNIVASPSNVAGTTVLHPPAESGKTRISLNSPPHVSPPAERLKNSNSTICPSASYPNDIDFLDDVSDHATCTQAAALPETIQNHDPVPASFPTDTRDMMYTDSRRPKMVVIRNLNASAAMMAQLVDDHNMVYNEEKQCWEGNDEILRELSQDLEDSSTDAKYEDELNNMLRKGSHFEITLRKI